jgi:hypothetical protein
MLVELRVQRFENDKVILISEDNFTIVWPRKKLPADITEGSLIAISVNEKATQPTDNNELAKNILNELLDIGESA